MIEKRFFSAKQRDKLASKGDALPDGSFPIKNKKDLANAKKLVGRSKHPKAAEELIERRESELSKSAFGVTHEISKGSPQMGLRLIGAYGKKPNAAVKGLSRVGGPRKSVVSDRIKNTKKPVDHSMGESS